MRVAIYKFLKAGLLRQGRNKYRNRSIYRNLSILSSTVICYFENLVVAYCRRDRAISLWWKRSETTTFCRRHKMTGTISLIPFLRHRTLGHSGADFSGSPTRHFRLLFVWNRMSPAA